MVLESGSVFGDAGEVKVWLMEGSTDLLELQELGPTPGGTDWAENSQHHRKYIPGSYPTQVYRYSQRFVKPFG